MEEQVDTELIGKRRAWVEERRDTRTETRWRAGLIEHGADWTDRTPASRALHRLGEITARATAGVVIAIAVLIWGVIGVFTGFPHWWEVALYATSTSVTLVMVFAIQHTQFRQEMAIQRKLDELLRAMPAADDGLIAAEDAPDDELEALAALNRADRERRGPDADDHRS